MLSKLAPKKIGWEPYVYLIYLAILIFQPLFDTEATWRDWLALAGIIAVFLPIYFWGFLEHSPKRLWAVAAMVVLAMVSVQFFNSGATVFFVYAAAATPFVVARRQAMLIIGLILICVLMSFALSFIPFPYRWPVFVPAFIFVPLIGMMQLFQAEKEQSNARLRLAQDEIERLATIAERERIARDLHDLLGHTLSMITLKSELAGKLLERDIVRAKAEIAEVERISRDTLTEVRMAVSGYRAKGFRAELETARLALESAGISFSFKGDPAILNSLQESTLSLVLREAITNIVRHAEATRCSVNLQEDKGIRLEIADNGKGFQNARHGNGLTGITERLEYLGGNLDIQTTAEGTQLLIHLPHQESLGARNLSVVS